VRLNQAVAELKSYDWILFSNPVCIDLFFARFFQTYNDLRELGNVRLCAYGPMTAQKLREWRLHPAAAAADHKTPLIMEAIKKCGEVRGKDFWCFAVNRRGKKFRKRWRNQGASLTWWSATPPTGNERPTGEGARLVEEGADWIVFASGLAIEHFHARFDLPRLMARFPGTRLAIATVSIKWALDNLGLEPAVIARSSDVESLVNAITKAIRSDDFSTISSESRMNKLTSCWRFAQLRKMK